MVTIANPIYDTVFKHLMEDQEVARGLLSCLLDVDILSVTPRPQEVTDVQVTPPLGAQDAGLRVFRLDFTAIVRLGTGETKKVILELQKAGKAEALLRFRNYLGRTYLSGDRDEHGQPLPVLAVYILGFNANRTRPALVLVNTHLKDGITKEDLSAPEKPDEDSFFRALTHNAAFVQIPRIKYLQGDGLVEQTLRMFNQSYIHNDPHFLRLSDEMIQNGPEWLQKAFRLLVSAAANDEVRKSMAVEDEIGEMFENLTRQMEEERRLKEEERRLKEEERRLKEEERRLKEEERKLKEEAEKKAAEALNKAEQAQLKAEEEQKLKEEALAKTEAMARELEALRRRLSS